MTPKIVHSDAVIKKMVHHAFQVLWICKNYYQVLWCTLNLYKWISSTCFNPLQLAGHLKRCAWSIVGLIGRVPSHVAKVFVLALSTSDLQAYINCTHWPFPVPTEMILDEPLWQGTMQFVGFRDCKMTIYSGFTHWKLWFSIVMLVYQRVYIYIYLLRHVKTTFVWRNCSWNTCSQGCSR